MAYWNCHALEGHANETERGSFVSPVTNENCNLTWAETKLAETILRRLPTTESNPWGLAYTWVVTNATLSAWAGKYISPPLYTSSINKLELAGVLEVIRELGEGHKVTIGRLLRCDLDNCQEPGHYPSNYPLPKLSPPKGEIKGELSKPEETPLVHLDIKNLNNPLRTLNTLSESSNDLVSLPGNQESAPAQGVSDEPLDLENLLPRYWVEWLWIRARKRGLEQPSPIDIGHARNEYEVTGLDLEPGGVWQDGRPNPKPVSTNNPDQV